MTVEDLTTVPAPAVKEPAAVSKLETLLDKPIRDASLPADTAIKVLPDGSIRVGRYVAIWRRFMNSATMWVQGVAGVLAAAWLAIPQETFMSLVPSKYVAWGTIAYAIINVLARMRTI